MVHRFSHVNVWIFDLDNTLYPPSARLFDQIEVKMTDYVMRALGVSREEADEMRARYWREYGTTLAGLMDRHGIDPLAYLADVHDISFASLTPDPALAAEIDALPGRKIVFTNGDAPYARKVLAARGLDQVLPDVHGVEHTDFIPKPERAAYEKVLSDAGIDPREAAMFEDDPRNLAVPHDMGMQCVLIAPPQPPAAHLHWQTEDLHGFLQQLNTKVFA